MINLIATLAGVQNFEPLIAQLLPVLNNPRRHCEERSNLYAMQIDQMIVER